METSEESVNDLSEDFLTINVANQMFGIPVLQVQDVLREQRVTKIPLAAPEVAGALNLRGRVVTAIDIRRCLSMDDREENASTMSIVVEYKEELFSLVIDSVGEVIRLDKSNFERNPSTLDPAWKGISSGIYQLEQNLLIILDVSKLLDNIKC